MTLKNHASSNGIIIESKPFVPSIYKNTDAIYQATVSAQDYTKYVDWYEQMTDVIVEKITYMSNGLQIVGFIARPAHQKQKKMPVIIYCRGGGQEDGKIMITSIKNRIYPLAQAGYIVLASQYRGNDGSQGKDEFGGADVNDVVALFDTAKTLDYADTTNIFMVGYSRGASNMYQTVKAGKRPNAIAAVAGLVDLFQIQHEIQKERPEIVPWLASMIPNLPQQGEAEYKKRSAIFWPDNITMPVLLLHGDADTVCQIVQSQRMAQALKMCGTPHKLVTYPNGDHRLSAFKNEVTQEIVNWFKLYTQ